MDEISLKGFISSIKKWKKFIIIITSVSVLSALFLSFFVLPPIYRGKAILLPPKIGSTYMFSAFDTKNIIESSVFIENISEKMASDLYFDRDNIGVTFVLNTNYVEVQFESQEKSTINNFFENLLIILNDSIDSEFSGKVETLKENIVSLLKRKESLEEQSKEIYSNIKNLSEVTSKDSEYYLALATLNSTYYSQTSSLAQIENNLLDSELILLSSRNFQYLATPEIETEPVRPKKFVNAIAAGISGFLFSIVLVFIIESFRDKRLS
jgi:capsular polysaccharide biosynthesis protein